MFISRRILKMSPKRQPDIPVMFGWFSGVKSHFLRDGHPFLSCPQDPRMHVSPFRMVQSVKVLPKSKCTCPKESHATMLALIQWVHCATSTCIAHHRSWWPQVCHQKTPCTCSLFHGLICILVLVLVLVLALVLALLRFLALTVWMLLGYWLWALTSLIDMLRL